MPKVLIADDEEFVRHYLKCLIENMKWKVAAETDSGDGLYELLNDVKPNVLLLDINMPHLKGDEFLKEYGKHFKDLCVIILTISASYSLQQELTNMGYEYFLRKDTEPAAICKYIQNCWFDFMGKRK